MRQLTRTSLIFCADKISSRPDPHKNLKKFLGPAFTVTSVDKLDSFFKACVGQLLANYYRQVKKTDSQTGFVTDLMRDLHCLALDMYVPCAPLSLDTQLTLHEVWVKVHSAKDSDRSTRSLIPPCSGLRGTNNGRRFRTISSTVWPTGIDSSSSSAVSDVLDGT